MGLQHLTRAAFLVGSALLVAVQAGAVELGELQAVAGRQPPYVFRLAIVPAPHAPSDIAAVTVRQPPDAISFVKNQLLELRLHTLTDVELEVSQGGQTLNRLLLSHELQAARARLDAATAWQRYQAAKARDAPLAQLAGLLATAYQRYQTWGQFDPAAAHPRLAQVEQERRRVLSASSRPPEPSVPEASMPAQTAAEAKLPAAATLAVPAGAGLERELQVIRQEMHQLVGRVTPWAGAATPSGPAATPLTTLLLGGLLIAGVVSLGTGYVLQRRALAGECQRRRWLTTSMRQAPARSQQRWRVAPVTVRRLRVSHHTRRRVRVHVARHRGAPTRLVAPLAHPRPAPPAELVEALDNLRRELLNLQRLLPSARRAATPAAGSIAASRASGRSS